MEQVATVDRWMGGRRLLVPGLLLLWLIGFLLGRSTADRELLGAVYARESQVLTDLAQGFTLLGDWELLVALAFLAAAFLIWRARRRLALLLVAGLLVGRLAVGLQKIAFDRLRPDKELWLTGATSMSFPSGHSANAMATYLALALLVSPPERRRDALIAAVLISLAVGLSRVMLGVHWPSDVLAGWAFGALWAIALAALAERIETRAT